MGTWHLEAFKLAWYVTFPVGMFYYFNQAQYFEDWIIQTKREMYPPEHLRGRVELAEFVKKAQRDQELKLVRQLQKEQQLKNESN